MDVLLLLPSRPHSGEAFFIVENEKTSLRVRGFSRNQSRITRRFFIRHDQNITLIRKREVPDAIILWFESHWIASTVSNSLEHTDSIDS